MHPALAMSLYRYFKPTLPSPSGHLAESINPATIKAANEAVKDATSKPSKARGSYRHVDAETQAKIAQYACEHGNKAAMERFSTLLGFDIKKSSVSTWKMKYLAEIKRRVKTGEAPEVNRLPLKKRGRRLLIGEKLDGEVKAYIQAVRNMGGVVTTTITIAVGRAIVNRADRSLLAENGGPITLSKSWAKSVLYRLNFVKRRGTATSKITVKNFEELKEQFLLDIKAVVEMEEIPPELVINWDQTGISIVPGSAWTMDLKGSKRVEIVGISDKRQITALFCGSLAGDFLPLQLIYQGKTAASLPQFNFPSNWHVTCTPNHWSNNDKMIEYVTKIIIPYIECKRRELKLSDDYPALAIFDVFRGQQTDQISSLLEENNIYVVNIPPNCTDRLQPMDLSVNKSAKDFMRAKFSEWYALAVQKQLDSGAEEVTPVDLRLSIMKPLGARWLLSLYDYLKNNRSIIKNGFKDITDFVSFS